MITIQELRTELDNLKDNGVQLLNISNEIDMVSALLSAIDNEFDQSIIDAGKKYPNAESRKMAKELLRTYSEVYQDNQSKLNNLKQEKQRLYNDREYLKGLLELGKLEITQDNTRQQAEILDGWIRLKSQ
jgi:hypothetical protein